MSFRGRRAEVRRAAGALVAVLVGAGAFAAACSEDGASNASCESACKHLYACQGQMGLIPSGDVSDEAQTCIAETCEASGGPLVEQDQINCIAKTNCEDLEQECLDQPIGG